MAEEKKEEKKEDIKSKDGLVYKYLTPTIYEKLKNQKTKLTNFKLDQCIACAVQTDDCELGMYAGDAECYDLYKDLFGAIIKDYHNYDADANKHISDLDTNKIKGNIDKNIPVISTRIRVARNISGYGLSPGISKKDRLEIEQLMINCFKTFTGDLEGTYYPLKGMDEKLRLKLIDDHYLFISGDKYFEIAGMARDWPEGRGIFLNKNKTFLIWVNEEDHLRIISMQKGNDVKQVFDRLVLGINTIEKFVIAEKKKKFIFHEKYGYISSCTSNIGTGLRASVHLELGNLVKKFGGKKDLKKYARDMSLQLRGSRGEVAKDESNVFDISNVHRLGYTEVKLVQTMIDGVNKLGRMDIEEANKNKK